MSIKRIIFILLILSGCFSLSAQEAKDVVLMVDTSAGMFSYYNEVSSYLTGPFLAENLKIGDTLHIISFASKPRFEIARRLLGKGDIETVSGRIWLLYPLENNTGSTDASLSYAEQYVRSIPGGRTKKVFVISNDEGVGRLTDTVAGRLKPNGVDVIFIKASERMAATPMDTGSRTRDNTPPRVQQTSTVSIGGRTPIGTTPAGNTTTSTTVVGTTATGTTTTGTTATGPITIGNTTTGTTVVGTTATATTATGTITIGNTGTDTTAAGNTADSGAITDSNNLRQTGEKNEEEEKTNEQTGSPGSGEPANGTELVQNRDESYNSGIQPAAVTTPVTARSDTTAFPALSLPLLLGLLLLLLLLVIIIAIRKHGFSFRKGATFTDDGTTARNAEFLNNFASSRQAQSSLQGTPRHSQYKDPGRFLTDPPMLSLFVEEQNTAIGKRNIHALKKGNTYSIGGGTSDFLIFLVPVPPKVAELYFDGNNCTFTPLKPKYFPDLGSTQVNECIGKTIRLLSDKNYEVFFHFERYRDPLIALNQLLHSIQTPEEKKKIQ